MWQPEFMKGATELPGTCIDLEIAYRQCSVAEMEKMCTVLAIRDLVSHKTIYVIAKAFPCSRRGFVHESNRAANALNHILHEDAGATASNCFMLAPWEGLRQSTSKHKWQCNYHFHSWCCKGLSICTSNSLNTFIANHANKPEEEEEEEEEEKQNDKHLAI